MKKALLILALVSITFAIHVGFSVRNTVKEYDEYVRSDSSYVSRFDSALNDASLVQLIRQRTLSEALLKQSGGEEIGLVVDLADSTVSLMVKGVEIHSVKTSLIASDPMLDQLPSFYYQKLFSAPLTIRQEYSSIVKEPIVMRDAPANPEEAAINAYSPDTLIQNPSFVRFTLDHRIDIVFEQEENKRLNEKWVKFNFWSHEILLTVLDRLVRFVTFDRQYYQPELRIELPQDDLRAIYRALPVEAKVVIRY